jgi:hypothetical protein
MASAASGMYWFWYYFVTTDSDATCTPLETHWINNTGLALMPLAHHWKPLVASDATGTPLQTHWINDTGFAVMPLEHHWKLTGSMTLGQL